MTMDQMRDRHKDGALRDIGLASLAWLASSMGLMLGVKPLLAVFAVLALPVVAYVAFGHLAGRGAVMACLVSALGVGMTIGSTPGELLSAALLIGVVDVAAFAAGSLAERMAPAQQPVLASPSAGGAWMAVVVHHQAAAVVEPRPIEAPIRQPARAKSPRTRRPVRLDRSA